LEILNKYKKFKSNLAEGSERKYHLLEVGYFSVLVISCAVLLLSSIFDVYKEFSFFENILSYSFGIYLLNVVIMVITSSILKIELDKSEYESIIDNLNKIVSISSIKYEATYILDSWNWQIKNGDTVVEIPKNVELIVINRSFVFQEQKISDNFTRFEVIVWIGQFEYSDSCKAKYCALKMYFNTNGRCIKSERINA